MNDKPEIKPKGITPLKHICMTIGELPSSYLETMTYYEMLLWFTKFLQERMIPALDNNALAVEELQGLFIELQTYVNNYFDNLDVQDEINNKLDQLLEDGVLEQIIEQFLQLTSLICFDNVAGMKLSPNLANGSFAKTLGYYSKNDGGEALYKIRNITNDDVIDEGSIIALNNNLLVAELIINSNTINIKQFGCKDDSSFDNTQILQHIISNFNNYEIFVPIGKFKITSTISLNNVEALNIKGIKNDKVNNSSVIYINTDNEISMFQTTNNTKLTGVLDNLYFMVNPESYYAVPSKTFMYGVQLNNAFIINNCIIMQFRNVFSSCSIGSRALITNNEIRGIGNAIIYNTVVGDARFFNNYFNGYKNIVSNKIVYPDFMKDDTTETHSFAMFENNWFEFFRIVFDQGITALNISGNVFDFCLKLIVNANYDNLFSNNIVNHHTIKEIQDNSSASGYSNGMFIDEEVFLFTLYGSNNMIINNVFMSPFNSTYKSKLLELYGYQQTGSIQDIYLKDNAIKYNSVYTYLVKNSNTMYPWNNNNLINLYLDDYAKFLKDVDIDNIISNNGLIKGVRFYSSNYKCYVTPKFITNNYNPYLVDDNEIDIEYTSPNIVLAFTDLTRNKITINSSNFAKANVETTGTDLCWLTHTYDISDFSNRKIRISAIPNVNNKYYRVRLVEKDSSNAVLNTYMMEITNTPQKAFRTLNNDTKTIDLYIEYSASNSGETNILMMPSITCFTSNKEINIIKAKSTNGSITNYSEYYINDVLNTNVYY